MSLGGVFMNFMKTHVFMNTSPAMVTCVGSRTVKMKCWQLLLWSEQEKWKRLLKHPSHCECKWQSKKGDKCL